MVSTNLKVRRFVPTARRSVTSLKALAAARLRLHLPRSFRPCKKVSPDCGLTGTLPAYNAKWWQVVTHNIRIRLGYASSFLAFNLKTWNSLDDETKALFKRELPKLEEEMWVATAKNDQRGMDRNASGPCKDSSGKDLLTGGMIPIEPTDADKAKLKEVVENFVLKRWAKRCGTQKCVMIGMPPLVRFPV